MTTDLAIQAGPARFAVRHRIRRWLTADGGEVRLLCIHLRLLSVSIRVYLWI